MQWTIYCHTHVASGRRYIGLTSRSMLERWKGHVYDSKAATGRWAFARAIREYGRDAFAHEVLEVCATREAGNEAEDAWIEAFSTRDPRFGFNQRKGGLANPQPRAVVGAAISASLRRPESVALRSSIQKEVAARPGESERRSAIAKQAWADPVAAVALEAKLKAAKATPEVRAKMSAAVKVSHNTPEYLAAAAESRAKVWQRPGYRERVTAAIQVGKSRPEDAEKRSTAAKLCHASPEIRALQAEKQRALWADTDFKAKQSQAIKATRTPEFRADQSIRSKAQWENPETRARNLASLAAARAERKATFKPKPCKHCGHPKATLPSGKLRCTPCHTINERARLAKKRANA